MKRHRFNIFPEAKAGRLSSGYGKTSRRTATTKSSRSCCTRATSLDGWNRQKACDELGIAARYQHFTLATTIRRHRVHDADQQAAEP
jgi:hypothetical protein